MPESRPTHSRADHFHAILREMGRAATGASILDFGCGGGAMLRKYAEAGLDAKGCDIRPRDNPETQRMIDAGIIRIMDPPEYRIPFDDNSFDLVTSDQVMEHVQDYDSALAEIARVLKPGGASLHIFPSRYKLVEPHQRVPLATRIQSRWWLQLWAALGVRNVHQEGLDRSEVVERNVAFLTERTNYLPKSVIRKHFESRFATVRFVEREFLKHSRRGKSFYKASTFPLLGFLPDVYSTLQSRAIFAADPRK